MVGGVVLAAVMAGVCLAAGVTSAPDSIPAARTGDLVGSTIVCPDLQNVNGDFVATTLTAGTTYVGTGKTEIYGIASSKEPRRTLLDHGPAVKRYVSTTSGPVVVHTTGAITGGVVATQLGRGRLTENRGYAETACTPPLTEQWFVGASTTVGADPYVQLVNVEDFSALVDITVLTPDGEADAPTGQNIVVPGRNAVRVRLDTLAPDAKMTAVKVSTRTGRVAAALRDTHTRGNTELGTDWVPVTRFPARTVTIPGIPADGDPPLSAISLAVANPNERDTIVSIKAIASDGVYIPSRPVSLDNQRIPAGTVKKFDLLNSFSGNPAAVQITSTDAAAPILAGISVDAKSAVSDIHELMYLGAQLPLTDETYLPEIRVDDNTDVFSTLLLSAPERGARITLTFDTANGGRLAKGRTSNVAEVSIPQGRTVAVDLGKYVTGKATALIVVTTGSGPLYAVRYLHERGARGPLISALAPVNRQPPVEIPAVQRNLDVWQTQR